MYMSLFNPPAADRGRMDKGKARPKSEGFELYNNSVQNGSPESPQGNWDSYPEQKRDERLLKNRADHRSSPNVASEWPNTPYRIGLETRSCMMVIKHGLFSKGGFSLMHTFQTEIVFAFLQIKPRVQGGSPCTPERREKSPPSPLATCVLM